MNNLILYILMRIDLPSMTTGRATAQASHAANAFIFEQDHRSVKQWQKQTSQGFGTAIVLGATIEQITAIVASAHPANIIANQVIDPDYGIQVNKEVFSLIDGSKQSRGAVPKDDMFIVFREEVTCAYVFGDKEEVNRVLLELSQLSLYP